MLFHLLEVTTHNITKRSIYAADDSNGELKFAKSFILVTCKQNAFRLWNRRDLWPERVQHQQQLKANNRGVASANFLQRVFEAKMEEKKRGWRERKRHVSS